MSELSVQMTAEMAELVANVAANTDKVDSAVTAFEGLATKQAELIQQLTDALANVASTPEIQAAVDGLVAQNDALVANTSKLAAAIPAGTTPEPPVEPPVEPTV